MAAAWRCRLPPIKPWPDMQLDDGVTTCLRHDTTCLLLRPLLLPPSHALPGARTPFTHYPILSSLFLFLLFLLFCSLLFLLFYSLLFLFCSVLF